MMLGPKYEMDAANDGWSTDFTARLMFKKILKTIDWNLRWAQTAMRFGFELCKWKMHDSLWNFKLKDFQAIFNPFNTSFLHQQFPIFPTEPLSIIFPIGRKLENVERKYPTLIYKIYSKSQGRNFCDNWSSWSGCSICVDNSHKDLSDEKPKEKQKAGKSPHADSQEEKLLESTAFWSVQRKAEKNKRKSKEMPTFSLDLCSWIFSDSDQS